MNDQMSTYVSDDGRQLFAVHLDKRYSSVCPTSCREATYLQGVQLVCKLRSEVMRLLRCYVRSSDDLLQDGKGSR